MCEDVFLKTGVLKNFAKNMLCFLATKVHELPLSTSLSTLYFLVTTSYQQPTSCHAINPQTNTVKRLYILFEKVFVLFFNAMSSNSNFFASYLGSHCIEVPLKRSFLFNGPKKLVPLSESPTYPGSH